MIFHGLLGASLAFSAFLSFLKRHKPITNKAGIYQKKGGENRKTQVRPNPGRWDEFSADVWRGHVVPVHVNGNMLSTLESNETQSRVIHVEIGDMEVSFSRYAPEYGQLTNIVTGRPFDNATQ
jgi:hypothetical protein